MSSNGATMDDRKKKAVLKEGDDVEKNSLEGTKVVDKDSLNVETTNPNLSNNIEVGKKSLSGARFRITVPGASKAWPRLHHRWVAQSVDVEGESNFPKGCQFSPDGLCLLTCTALDNHLRLYNTPQLLPPSIQTSKSLADTDGNDDGESRKEMRAMEHGASTPVSPSENQGAPWRTALVARPGETVRSYEWYPKMNSNDPTSSVFVCASRDQSIHLMDAYTGGIRASYCPYNALDEMESPTVVTFTPDGSHIVAGGFRTDRVLHFFSTGQPGKLSDVRRLGATRRSSDGQKGLVAAISFAPTHMSVFAVGTYSPGSIYLYDARLPSLSIMGRDDDNSGRAAGTLLPPGSSTCVVGHGKRYASKKRRFAGVGGGSNKSTRAVVKTGTKSDATVANNKGDKEDQTEAEDDATLDDMFSAAKLRWYHERARTGVTQLSWSPTHDYLLYSASRRSDHILVWDIRRMSSSPSRSSAIVGGCAAYGPRNATTTHQRIEFDLYQNKLFVGNQDGVVQVFDTARSTTGGKPMQTLLSHVKDVVNGVSYCPLERLPLHYYGGVSSWQGTGLLAMAVGGRRFPPDTTFDDDDDSSGDNGASRSVAPQPPGSLELYWLTST